MPKKSKKASPKTVVAVGQKLKLGLPKGSLQEATFKLFNKAGYRVQVSLSQRIGWTAPIFARQVFRDHRHGKPLVDFSPVKVVADEDGPTVDS